MLIVVPDLKVQDKVFILCISTLLCSGIETTRWRCFIVSANRKRREWSDGTATFAWVLVATIIDDNALLTISTLSDWFRMVSQVSKTLVFASSHTSWFFLLHQCITPVGIAFASYLIPSQLHIHRSLLYRPLTLQMDKLARLTCANGMLLNRISFLQQRTCPTAHFYPFSLLPLSLNLLLLPRPLFLISAKSPKKSALRFLRWNTNRIYIRRLLALSPQEFMGTRKYERHEW